MEYLRRTRVAHDDDLCVYAVVVGIDVVSEARAGVRRPRRRVEMCVVDVGDDHRDR